jgi:hypothetical protein
LIWRSRGETPRRSLLPIPWSLLRGSLFLETPSLGDAGAKRIELPAVHCPVWNEIVARNHPLCIEPAPVAEPSFN